MAAFNRNDSKGQLCSACKGVRERAPPRDGVRQWCFTCGGEGWFPFGRIVGSLEMDRWKSVEAVQRLIWEEEDRVDAKCSIPLATASEGHMKARSKDQIDLKILTFFETCLLGAIREGAPFDAKVRYIRRALGYLATLRFMRLQGYGLQGRYCLRRILAGELHFELVDPGVPDELDVHEEGPGPGPGPEGPGPEMDDNKLDQAIGGAVEVHVPPQGEIAVEEVSLCEVMGAMETLQLEGINRRLFAKACNMEEVGMDEEGLPIFSPKSKGSGRESGIEELSLEVGMDSGSSGGNASGSPDVFGPTPDVLDKVVSQEVELGGQGVERVLESPDLFPVGEVVEEPRLAPVASIVDQTPVSVDFFRRPDVLEAIEKGNRQYLDAELVKLQWMGFPEGVITAIGVKVKGMVEACEYLQALGNTVAFHRKTME